MGAFTSFVLMMFFTGIILVVTNELTYGKPREIQYRYLPRTLDEFIRTQEMPSALFGSLWDVDPRRGTPKTREKDPTWVRQSN